LENFVFMLINTMCANRTKMTCAQPNLSEIAPHNKAQANDLI
jgi:hypothetical protein